MFSIAIQDLAMDATWWDCIDKMEGGVVTMRNASRAEKAMEPYGCEIGWSWLSNDGGRTRPR